MSVPKDRPRIFEGQTANPNTETVVDTILNRRRFGGRRQKYPEFEAPERRHSPSDCSTGKLCVGVVVNHYLSASNPSEGEFKSGT